MLLPKYRPQRAIILDRVLRSRYRLFFVPAFLWDILTPYAEAQIGRVENPLPALADQILISHLAADVQFDVSEKSLRSDRRLL